MNKKEALEEIFNIENIEEKLTNSNYKLTARNLLDIISRKKYSFREDLEVSETSATRTIKFLWPDKPTSSTKLCTWLLLKYSLRMCPNCEQVKDLDLFAKNAAKKHSGVNTHCKECTLDTRRDYQREYQAARRASKIERIPSWANLEKIKEIYENCPIDMHVDHIIPLKGKLVSGLHVENNLQYLSAAENIKKTNSFVIE